MMKSTVIGPDLDCKQPRSVGPWMSYLPWISALPDSRGPPDLYERKEMASELVATTAAWLARTMERYSKPYYPGHYACIGMSEQISRHAAEGN
jgi:hypothetical protein